MISANSAAPRETL